MKKIEINDIYSYEELIAQLPFYADTCFDIRISVEGFVHDVFTSVVLTPSSDPQGWETARADFAAVKLSQRRTRSTEILSTSGARWDIATA
ncbi:MAG: hypothetical protein NC548_59940 [Lachnospiraceae bacterium]|nr:hypothetical protein [Lachnospiraceae bacterium]